MQERIEKSGGRCSQTRVNEKLAMSRSIGDLDLKKFGVIAEPDIRMLKIDHPRDAFLVLTTDGINHVMTDKEIVETVKQTSEPQYAATLLTETVSICNYLLHYQHLFCIHGSVLFIPESYLWFSGFPILFWGQHNSYGHTVRELGKV